MKEKRKEENEIGDSTRSVHSGERRPHPYDSLTNSIVQTSTYFFNDTTELCGHMENRGDRGEYGRYGNPTQRVVEEKCAELDQGEDALLFSSGMNAITTTLLALLSKGQHLIITNDAYRRTVQFCQAILPRYGVEVSVTDPTTVAIRSALRENTRVIFSESPTNPYLQVLDLKELAALAHEAKVKTVIYWGRGCLLSFLKLFP